MKNRILSIVLVFFLAFASISDVTAKAEINNESPIISQEITVYLDNEKIEFDVQPIIENGRTLVPFRAVFEALGMSVDWDEATSSVTATGNGNSIFMQVNETVATVNGKTLYIDVAPKIIEGRTLVPLRFIAESIGANVEWDGENRIVNIYSAVSSDEKIRSFSVSFQSELPELGKVELKFDYSDSYFVNSNGYTYNHDLARASLAYEISSWDINELETMYSDKLRFSNYKLYNYEKSLDDGSDKAAYSIGHKDLYDGTTLLAIAVRGANYGAEWRSNFHLGDAEYHKGFYDPACEIYENLKKYANDNKIDLNTARLWGTGYSRGAAIGNILSGLIDLDILNNEKEYFENGNKLYSYLFAVPNGVDTERVDTSNKVFDNIYNIVLPYDIFPKLAMESWGWENFGKILMVKNRNSNSQYANEKYFKTLTNNAYEYKVGKKQTLSAEILVGILASSFGNSQKYNKTYESTVMDLTEWAFWVSIKNGDSTAQGLSDYIYEKYKNDDYDKSREYAESQIYTNYKLIKDVLEKNPRLTENLEEFEEYFYCTMQLFYLNGYSGDTKDLFAEMIDRISILGLFGVTFDSDVSIAEAHNCEYYISWMFGYDDPKEIFQNFE